MANATGFISTTTFSDEVMAGTDFCDHVTADDLSKGVGYFYERDSCGLVFAEICCEACMEKGKNAEAEVLVCCNDCKLSFPRKQTIAWRWYDFYAAQGDEPTIVCDGCRVAPKHQARVAQDQRDHDQEFGLDDEPDFDERDNEQWGSGAHLDDDEDDFEEEEVDDDQFVDEGEV